MKRTICLICILAITACLWGCGNKDEYYVRPVNVYFCTATYDYTSSSSIFDYEVRDFYGWNGRLMDFLNTYMTGSEKSDLVSPFPMGGKINDLHEEDALIELQLNTHFSRLSSHELTLACACLSMTIFSITDAEAVNMHVEGSGGNRTTITMTRDNLHLSDMPDVTQ